MTKRRIETGHQGWSCPQPLRPIGLPHKPMECEIFKKYNRECSKIERYGILSPNTYETI